MTSHIPQNHHAELDVLFSNYLDRAFKFGNTVKATACESL